MRSFTTPALPTGDLLVIATGEIGVPSFGDASFSLLAVGPKGSIGFIKQDPISPRTRDFLPGIARFTFCASKTARPAKCPS